MSHTWATESYDTVQVYHGTSSSTGWSPSPSSSSLLAAEWPSVRGSSIMEEPRRSSIGTLTGGTRGCSDKHGQCSQSSRAAFTRVHLAPSRTSGQRQTHAHGRTRGGSCCVREGRGRGHPLSARAPGSHCSPLPRGQMQACARGVRTPAHAVLWVASAHPALPIPHARTCRLADAG